MHDISKFARNQGWSTVPPHPQSPKLVDCPPPKLVDWGRAAFLVGGLFGTNFTVFTICVYDPDDPFGLFYLYILRSRRSPFSFFDIIFCDPDDPLYFFYANFLCDPDDPRKFIFLLRSRRSPKSPCFYSLTAIPTIPTIPHAFFS